MSSVIAGKLNVSQYFYIVGDASHASSGEPVTGLAFGDIETGGSASYMRQGAARVDLTLVTQTVTGAHTDGGFVEVDATNMPGVYRCDFPDAAFLMGADFVVLQIVVAAANNAVAEPIRLDISEEDIQFRKVHALIEVNRGHHSHMTTGNIFFVDPVNGDTHANGNRGGVLDPYLSVQDCHDNAVSNSAHDLVVLLPGASGLTTLTEDVILTKRYTFYRGPGRDFLWTRSGAGDTISVTADGNAFSGFQLETAGVGSGSGLDILDADFTEIRDLWINATQGDGIHILRGDNTQIFDNHFKDTGRGGSGQGIDIAGTGGSSNDISIFRNHFRDCAGDAIKISGGVTNDLQIFLNGIEGSAGWGINVGDSARDTLIHDNTLGNNSSGDINDGGIDTIEVNNGPWAKHTIATEARMAELDGANIPADIDALTVSEAAIKAKTDDLTFTKAKELDSNVQSLNGTTLAGDGSATPWGP